MSTEMTIPELYYPSFSRLISSPFLFYKFSSYFNKSPIVPFLPDTYTTYKYNLSWVSIRTQSTGFISEFLKTQHKTLYKYYISVNQIRYLLNNLLGYMNFFFPLSQAPNTWTWDLYFLLCFLVITIIRNHCNTSYLSLIKTEKKS